MKLTRDEVMQRLNDGDGARDLSGLDLAGVDLSRMDLRGVNLSRADLSTADLRWAILEGADLHSTVLHRADCRWAILRGANLRQADLGRANLGWADVTGADLTGATIQGTNLENVDLGDGLVERAPGPREWVVGGLPGARALPRSPATAAVTVGVAAAVLTHVWGWLYRRAYFSAFDLHDPAVTGLGRWGNMRAGFGVLGLTAKTVLASPLVLLALGFLLALGLAVPALLVVFGDRVLEPVPATRRTPVLVGLFIVYFLVLWAGLLPVAGRAAGWVFDRALPADEGLRSVFSLAAGGGLVVGLGFLALGLAVAVLVWYGWRATSRAMALGDLPAAWRLRYPRLNEAYARARLSRLFARHEALSPEERQRLVAAAAAAGVLLPTLLSQTGGVAAFHDMCNGGSLPRVQLYTGRQPEVDPADELICSRLLAKTDANYYVFFPSETTRIGLGGAAAASGGDDEAADVGTSEGSVVALSASEEDDAEAPAPGAGEVRDRLGLFRHQARVYRVARGEVSRRVDATGKDD
ncbi:MAG: pentapeptide repeat-containing protein, partial [Anaerolineae bacterium]